MSSRHPQVRQREQCHQLSGVFRQTTEARLHIAELAFDHSKRMFDLRAHLSFGLFDSALDDLRKVATFVRLSRSTAAILKQNIALALGIKAIFLGITITGGATMWMAVFADMGVSLLVVFNGLRLLRQ